MTNYYYQTLYNLSSIDVSTLRLCQLNCKCGNDDMIDYVFNYIVKSLKDASDISVPHIPDNFFKHWWNDNLTELKEQSIAAHRLWEYNGKPVSGIVYDIKRKAKAKYKQAMRQYNRDEQGIISNDLHEALLQKDQFSFWRTWNAKFGCRSNRADFINGSRDPMEIANKFASTFKTVCSPNSSTANANLFCEFLQLYDNYCGNNVNTNEDITVEMIDRCVRRMKLGKAAGIDGIEVEHIINAHPILISHLCVLFNAILCHGYVPGEFGTGIA